MSDVEEVSTPWIADMERRLGATGVAVSVGFGDVTVTIDPESWVDAVRRLRDDCAMSYFDWLSAVDEGQQGFSLFCHLYDPESHHHLLARTQLPRQDPQVASLTSVFRGAAWHERETAEMFGVTFVGHPYPARLLLSDEFEGHPLRKDFVLTARVSKTWPGAKEPGESGSGSPSRRKMQPPGVPDPTWGPRAAGEADG
jgi:NADH-quinone oxidoreductase subunit C